MKAFLCSLLFLLLMYSASGQDFYNPYPMTSQLTDCRGYDEFAPPDITQALCNYYYDKNHKLISTVVYYGKLFNSDTFHWKKVDTINYTYDSSNRYIKWSDHDYQHEEKYDSKNRISWFKRYKNSLLILFATFQYDASGHPTGTTYYTAKEGALYMKNDSGYISYIPFKQLWTYNGMGRQTQWVYQQQDSVSLDWNNVWRYDSVYEANGRDSARMHYIWRNNAWLLTDFVQCVFDKAGRKEGQLYYDVSKGVATQNRIDSVSYDTTGRKIMLVSFRMDRDSNWYQFYREVYNYFNEGHLMSIDISAENEEDRTHTYDEQGHTLFDGNRYIYYQADYKSGRKAYEYNQYFFGQGGSTYGCGTSFYYDSYPVFTISDLVISEHSKNSFGTFNNPVTDQLNIDVLDSISEPFQINLYSMTGKIVYYRNAVVSPGITHFSIDMQNLERGIYILIVRKGNNVYEKKIVKI